MFCHVVLYDEHVELPSWSQLQGCSPERLSCSVEVHQRTRHTLIISPDSRPDETQRMTQWLLADGSVSSQLPSRSLPPHCIRKRRPILIHLSRVSPGLSFGRVWRSLGDPASTGLDHLQLSTLQLRLAWDEDADAYRRRTQRRRSLCLLPTGRGPLVSILLFSLLLGNEFSKVMLPNEKLITRKYSIPDWMQGIDFFVRSSVFLSRGTGYEGWIISNIIKN